jgi:anti-sigma factor RsiW
MCNYSGRLIAWLDHELPEEEAFNVEWHVGQCAECRTAVRTYQEISGSFLDCYAVLMPVQQRRKTWRRVAGMAGIAAAILVVLVLTRPSLEQLTLVPRTPQAPRIAFEKTPPRIIALRPRPVVVRKPVRQEWTAPEPTVEIALPADAFFPPGAVPAGFSFIADVHFQH